MTDRPIQPVSPLPADPNLDPREAARLASTPGAAIRMLADGECDASAISGSLPTGQGGSTGERGSERLASQMDFESQLRASVSRVMSRDRAPESLRVAVLQAFVNESAAGVAMPAEPGSQTGETISLGGRTRSHSFWNRAAGWMALAAVLALAGVGVFGGLRAINSNDGFSPEYRQSIVNYVAHEHRSCDASAPEGQKKFAAQCVDGAEGVAKEVLGCMPDGLCARIRELESRGFTFAGMGRCGMPGEGASVHLVFRTPSDARASLFVQARTSDITIRSTCRYTSDRCAKSGNQMTVWRTENFVYFLYTTDDAAREAIAETFAVPGENRAL
ncbi:MAG: hypothetical protein ACTS3F_03150 [Phycisphaerales bacterium]